uniref:Protein kinase domain-containing protein n=1 Tax=Macrostomum lignano TaxID=282301 RepID=A0A1I8HP62_9PLAT
MRNRVAEIGSRVSEMGNRVPEIGNRVAEMGSRVAEMGNRVAEMVAEMGTRYDIMDKVARTQRKAVELQDLQTAMMSGCSSISDIGVGYLSTMPKLRSLCLRWCSSLSDTSIRHILNLRTLSFLSAAGNSRISGDGFCHLIRMRQLRAVELTNCPSATATIRKFLNAHLPSCRPIRKFGAHFNKTAQPIRIDVFHYNKLWSSWRLFKPVFLARSDLNRLSRGGTFPTFLVPGARPSFLDPRIATSPLIIKDESPAPESTEETSESNWSRRLLLVSTEPLSATVSSSLMTCRRCCLCCLKKGPFKQLVTCSSGRRSATRRSRASSVTSCVTKSALFKLRNGPPARRVSARLTADTANSPALDFSSTAGSGGRPRSWPSSPASWAALKPNSVAAKRVLLVQAEHLSRSGHAGHNQRRHLCGGRARQAAELHNAAWGDLANVADAANSMTGSGRAVSGRLSQQPGRGEQRPRRLVVGLRLLDKSDPVAMIVAVNCVNNAGVETVGWIANPGYHLVKDRRLCSERILSRRSCKARRSSAKKAGEQRRGLPSSLRISDHCALVKRLAWPAFALSRWSHRQRHRRRRKSSAYGGTPAPRVRSRTGCRRSDKRPRLQLDLRTGHCQIGAPSIVSAAFLTSATVAAASALAAVAVVPPLFAAFSFSLKWQQWQRQQRRACVAAWETEPRQQGVQQSGSQQAWSKTWPSLDGSAQEGARTSTTCVCISIDFVGHWPLPRRSFWTFNRWLQLAVQGEISLVRRFATADLVKTVDDDKGWTVLMLVATADTCNETPVSTTKCIEYFLFQGADPMSRDEESGDTAAHLAARRNQLRLLALLPFDSKWLLNWRGATPLMEAALSGSRDCAKHLLHLLRLKKWNQKSNDKRLRLLELKDSEGRSALDIAKSSGHHDLARLIERSIRAGVPAEASGLEFLQKHQGWSSCRSIRVGVPVEASGLEFLQKHQGWSSCRSIRAGVPAEASGLEFLQKHQGWSSCRSIRAGVPAEASGLEFLQKHQGWSSFRSIREVVTIENLTQLVDSTDSEALKASAALNWESCDLPNWWGQTALMRAAGNCRLTDETLWQRLMQCGDPTSASVDGFTCLHQAAGAGNSAAVSALIRAGAPPNARDSRGHTAIMVAARRAPTPVARQIGQILLDYGANWRLAEWETGRTALEIAEAYGRSELADLLLRCAPFVKRWDKERLLGRGGFGEVHEVVTDLGVRCAAKIIRLPVQLGDQPESTKKEIDRSIESERNLCQLQHDNIVKFLHICQPEISVVVLFMELLKGRSLERFLNRLPLEESQIQDFTR